MKLEHFCHINPSEQLCKNIEYDFVEMADIVPGKRYVFSKSKKIFNGSFSKFSNKDTLMAKITPCLENGKISQFIGSDKAFGSTEFNIFREKKDISDNDYLYYLISSPLVKRPAIKSMSGATGRQRANLDKIKQIEVPDISIKAQQKIAKFLSNYDDLIENNNRRIKILEEMAQKIYKEWFVDFKFPGHETTTFKDSPQGKIPNDWEVDFVKNILIRLKSKHKYTQNNILKEGKIIVIDQSTSEYLGFHNDKPDFKANPQKPLIIFGDHTCKMQMLVEDFSIGPNVIPISSEKVPITFLYYLIDSLIETKEYKRHWNDLISKKVVLPINSLSESFSNIITPLMTMINHLKHKNMKLKQTRDILLPRLITGEINVENMEVL